MSQVILQLKKGWSEGSTDSFNNRLKNLKKISKLEELCAFWKKKRKKPIACCDAIKWTNVLHCGNSGRSGGGDSGRERPECGLRKEHRDPWSPGNANQLSINISYLAVKLYKQSLSMYGYMYYLHNKSFSNHAPLPPPCHCWKSHWFSFALK